MGWGRGKGGGTGIRVNRNNVRKETRKEGRMSGRKGRREGKGKEGREGCLKRRKIKRVGGKEGQEDVEVSLREKRKF